MWVLGNKFGPVEEQQVVLATEPSLGLHGTLIPFRFFLNQVSFLDSFQHSHFSHASKDMQIQ